MNARSDHDWRPVLNELLEDWHKPRVCSRCLLREDNPAASHPCDAVAERLRDRKGDD